MFSRWSMSAIREHVQGYLGILPRIRCPVLLVRAAESWDLSPEQAARMIPLIRDCTYVEVPGSDHMVYADNPDGFYAAFDRFLGRL